MREMHCRKPVAAVLTLTICMLPVQPSLAAEGIANSSATAKVHDVALDRAGTLVGQLVNEQGLPHAGHRVVARRASGEMVEATSDANGRFRFTGLKGGIYEFTSDRSSIACRCWSANAAPPKAAHQILLVTGHDVRRGQRPIADLLCGPVLIGLIIAAAIAIPIAVHNSQNTAS